VRAKAQSFAWDFRREKVKYVSESTLALCSQKQFACKRIVLGAERFLTALNNVLFDILTVLF